MTPTNPLESFAKYVALRATAERIGLVGLDGVTLEANKMLVEVNMSTPTVYGLSIFPVVDFTSSFPDELLYFDTDGDGLLEIAEDGLDPLIAAADGQISGEAADGIVSREELLALDKDYDGKLEIDHDFLPDIFKDADADSDELIDATGFHVETGGDD